MQKSKNSNFIDKISKLLLWISLSIGLIAGIFTLINYAVHTGFNSNKGSISITVKFLFFALLIFIYRKIYVRRKY